MTNVADQGATEEEALARLKKGLEEHYRILVEVVPKGEISLMNIGVEKYVKASRALC